MKFIKVAKIESENKGAELHRIFKSILVDCKEELDSLIKQVDFYSDEEYAEWEKYINQRIKKAGKIYWLLKGLLEE